MMKISDLEDKTGYSRRYLEILFKNHIGFSPKTLATIFRFQKFYRKWATDRQYGELKEELYDHYFDQAHFVKEFKRMTGFSPQRFIREVSNEFGRKLSLH
jgi:methylphosphotriester-DNA--protein-cysteine methyltransferase